MKNCRCIWNRAERSHWQKEMCIRDRNQGKKYDVCVAIGPMIMMKFVCKLTKELGIPTIVSLNPIMVDGTGMCGACLLYTSR